MSRLIVLCEDKQQETFMRRTLKGLGFRNHEMYFVPEPDGRGSGEQFVRKSYAREVKAYRAHPHKTAGVLVLIDADTKSLPERHVQLEKELKDAALIQRQPTENIPILIPKRNIETWISYLLGNSVNEADVYPKLKEESDCWPGVDKLVNYYKANSLPSDSPPSLQEGVGELKDRLPKK